MAIDLEDLDRIVVRGIVMKAFDVFLPDKVALGHLEVYTYLTAEASRVADCPGDLEMAGGNWSGVHLSPYLGLAHNLRWGGMGEGFHVSMPCSVVVQAG